MMLRGTVMGEASSGGSKEHDAEPARGVGGLAHVADEKDGAGVLGGGLARPARGMAGSMTRDEEELLLLLCLEGSLEAILEAHILMLLQS